MPPATSRTCRGFFCIGHASRYRFRPPASRLCQSARLGSRDHALIMPWLRCPSAARPNPPRLSFCGAQLFVLALLGQVFACRTHCSIAHIHHDRARDLAGSPARPKAEQQCPYHGGRCCEETPWFVDQLPEQRVEHLIQLRSSGFHLHRRRSFTDIVWQSTVLRFCRRANDVPITGPKWHFTAALVEYAPQTQGIYELWEQGEIVYVGSTTRGRRQSIRECLIEHLCLKSNTRRHWPTHFT
jgi:hypothetical protein